MKDLNNVIDDVYEGTWIDFNELERGRIFIKKLRSDIEDFDNIIKKYNFNLDANGKLSGHSLFPITIEVLNREEAPGRDDVYAGGDYKILVVYYGICPELENFVSIILWPEQSRSSKEAYRLIYDLIKTDDKREKVFEFKNKYQIKLPNKIHPFWDREMGSINKHKFVYDWRYAPYIKEIGDSIHRFKSPLNFQKVYLDAAKNIKRYVNIKTTIGLVIKKQKNEIRIKLPFTGNVRKTYNAKIGVSVSGQLLKKHELFHFLIFEEVDDSPTPIIHEVAEANTLDCMGHLLSYRLYQNHLENQRLYVASREEFSSLFKECLNVVKRFTKGRLDSNYHFYKEELVFEAYLSPFFRWICDELYYIPYIIKNCSDEEISLYDKTLVNFKEFRWWGGRACPITTDNGTEVVGVCDHNIYRKLKFIIEMKRFISNMGRLYE